LQQPLQLPLLLLSCHLRWALRLPLPPQLPLLLPCLLRSALLLPQHTPLQLPLLLLLPPQLLPLPLLLPAAVLKLAGVMIASLHLLLLLLPLVLLANMVPVLMMVVGVVQRCPREVAPVAATTKRVACGPVGSARMQATHASCCAVRSVTPAGATPPQMRMRTPM